MWCVKEGFVAGYHTLSLDERKFRYYIAMRDQSGVVSLLLVVLALSLGHSTQAFHATRTIQQPRPYYVRSSFLLPQHSTTVLSVTAQDIIQQARSKSGLPEQESPQIFDQDILDDMQSALLRMERRIQEGPLTFSEVDSLEGELQRIVTDMKVNAHRKLSKPSKKVGEAAQASAPRLDPPSPVMTADSPTYSQATTSPAFDTPSVSNENSNDEEGPAFDGKGGMGQPRGTVNTYAIPGMDEMTPEEYQKALEQAVIERARQRRYSGQPSGNRATWDYLNHLSGETGILKKNPQN